VRERGRHRVVEQIPLAVHVNELFDLLIGVLTAEVSEQTRGALSNTRAGAWAKTPGLAP
jgi:hypothetical protein